NETLAHVEAYSTSHCAHLITHETLGRAKAINQQLRELVETEFSPEQFTELNEQFHSTLFEHHQNSHILDLVHRGWNRLAALRSSTFSFIPSRSEEHTSELQS